MKPRLSRALLVVAVFALLAAITTASHYVSDTTRSVTPPAAPPKPLDVVFWSSFRYYLAWALCTPFVFWLARRAPLIGPRRYRSVAVHLAVPAVAALPFFTFRLLLNTLLTFSAPRLDLLASIWRFVWAMETLVIYPIYWLLLGVGTMLQVQRAAAARQVHAVDLERSLTDAQLDTLRMKLQPHFLFNTLNAIGALAQQGDTDDVVLMVEHLGTLLRLSMETSARQLVTLEEELHLLDAYLAIEEVRHKNRLVVSRDIDPGIGATLVPTLILQPLVENAVAHGLGGRIDATSIEILARRNAEGVEVAISDDGPGLPAGWTLARNAGRGLGNVLERLAALYGDRAQLEVAGRPEGGR